MTRQSKLLILMVAFCFLATSGILALQKSDETVTCPISGDEIKKSEAKGSCELDGKTYYFCCENCKEAFVKNPEKYTQEKEHEGHMHGEDLHKGHEHAEDKDNDTLKDPVCGMEIEKSEAKFTHEHNGETYYFCMEGCKEKFVDNPEKYIKKEEKTVTCPVSGDVFKKSEADGSYEYNGETYYLCCEGCMMMFVENPEEYIKKKE